MVESGRCSRLAVDVANERGGLIGSEVGAQQLPIEAPAFLLTSAEFTGGRVLADLAPPPFLEYALPPAEAGVIAGMAGNENARRRGDDSGGTGSSAGGSCKRDRSAILRPPAEAGRYQGLVIDPTAIFPTTRPICAICESSLL